MTEEKLPFDGGDTPEPVTEPAIGHWVTVKDDDRVGDDVGEIIGRGNLLGVTVWFVAFRDADGFIYHVGKEPQEMLEYVGLTRPESETTE